MRSRLFWIFLSVMALSGPSFSQAIDGIITGRVEHQ